MFNTYLNFNGRCAEAFRFYERCFGGKIQFLQTFGESPMKDQVGPDWQDKIMHVTLAVGDNVVMGSDAPPAYYGAPRGMYVSLRIADAAEGERVFNALAKDGQINMPFQKTFWSAGFGMVVDRFAIPWMVNCD